MILANIPNGTSVFLDANTLVYHFSAHPQFGPSCTNLIKRVEQKHVSGFISTHVVSDVAHRLMTIEAMLAFGWPAAGIAQRLRCNRRAIAGLSAFRQAVDQIPLFDIQVLQTNWQQISDATAISQQYELLSGDALIVALMKSQGLSNLASHDADFDQVSGLTRYSPI